MAKALWNGVVLAESDDIVHVEGNGYFPKSAVNWAHLRENGAVAKTFCHWKGFAAYYDVVAGGEILEAAAWRYDAPYDQAVCIADRIAFWKGVEVTGVPDGPGYVEPEPSLRGAKSGWEALCWLLRHPPKNALTATDIKAYTDIPETGIRDAWQVFDVQRYARRYRWTLEGGDGDAPLQLRQADGEPVSID